MKVEIKEEPDCKILMNMPSLVWEEFKDLSKARAETLFAIYTDVKRVAFKKDYLTTGTIDTATYYPRELFRRVLLNDAASVILVHNHPSGVPDPSRSDISFTEKIKKGLNTLEVDLLDHVIIGETYFSFKEKGIL